MYYDRLANMNFSNGRQACVRGMPDIPGWKIGETPGLGKCLEIWTHVGFEPTVVSTSWLQVQRLNYIKK